MSLLDIIIISLGALAVILYGTFKILELKKYQKELKDLIDKGYTQEQAKKMLEQKRQKGKKSKKQQNEDDDLAD